MTIESYRQALHEEPTVVCLIGPSGAGKSTLADRLANSDDQIVDTDELRWRLTGDASRMEASGVAHQLAYRILRYRAGHDHTTIFDSLALQPAKRRAVAERSAPLRCWGLIVEAPLEVCLKRQEMRDRQVPSGVVEKQHERLGDLEFQPGRFDRIDAWKSEPGELVEVA